LYQRKNLTGEIPSSASREKEKRINIIETKINKVRKKHFFDGKKAQVGRYD